MGGRLPSRRRASSSGSDGDPYRTAVVWCAAADDDDVDATTMSLLQNAGRLRGCVRFPAGRWNGLMVQVFVCWYSVGVFGAHGFGGVIVVEFKNGLRIIEIAQCLMGGQSACITHTHICT